MKVYRGIGPEEGTIVTEEEAGLAASEIATPDEKRLLKERYGVDIG